MESMKGSDQRTKRSKERSAFGLALCRDSHLAKSENATILRMHDIDVVLSKYCRNIVAGLNGQFE